LAGYYRRFIQDYERIAAPLVHLLRKDAFRWGPRQRRHALTTAPVLQLPDFNQGFVVKCDASRVGISAVLHQWHGRIAFFSKQLTACHAWLTTYEYELIGLVLAV
jgi:hypothetical protein